MTTTDDTVKTRKKHECRVCGEIIPAGETVVRRAGFDCDGPWTIHMHPECERLTKDWDSMDWESIGPGELKRPNSVISDGVAKTDNANVVDKKTWPERCCG